MSDTNDLPPKLPKKNLLFGEIEEQKIKEAGYLSPTHAKMMKMRAIRKLDDRQLTIAHMAACGKKASEIAEIIGISSDSVNNTLKDQRMRAEVHRLRQELFGKDMQAVVRAVTPDAVKVAYDLMMSAGVKDNVRLAAAQDFMDRSLGKPTQTVDVGGPNIKRLFELLDEKKVEPEDEEIEAIFTELNGESELNESEDETEEWVKENLKDE